MRRERIKNLILNILIVVILFSYLFYGAYPKHSDFWGLNYIAQSFGKGEYDFYNYVINVQGIHNYIIYPADFYILQGTYLKGLSIIFSSNINTWVLLQPDFAPWFFPFFGILPNIILFFIGGLLIYKVYPRKELVVAYLASPLAFISIQIMGQADIYPAFFTLLALYFTKKSFDTPNHKWKLASIISLGIGAEFKTYPLLLLIPLAIFLADKNTIQTLKYIILGISVSLAPWIPYLKWFKPMVLEGESNWLYNLQLAPINLPPYHTISIWIVGYCICLWVVFRYIKTSFKNLVGTMFLSCSWFFMAVYTHPQWWVWLLPISIFVLAEFEDKIFRYLYVALNVIFILYPMMWTTTEMIPIIHNYIPTIPIAGTSATILVSLIVSILLIWNLELLNAMIKKRKTVS